jgi:SSS family transporter
VRQLRAIDWAVVGLYFLFMLVVGLYFARQASRSVADYFVSGRDLPWWVIALSAVATYTDAGLAPAVTMLTYQGGLLGNAIWWIPYVIWMPLGAVLWSKYWRRLGTVTSAELLSVRYSGKFASTYRGVYSVFMSFGFIVVLMGYVSGWLGAALGPILGWEPISLILFAAIITAAYTVTSGLSGVAYTDAYQFGIFLIGNIILVPVVLFAVGGMDQVYQTIEATRGAGAESFFRVLPPVSGLDTLTVFAFMVQGLFFAASPTGGEGFTAQRFMAARNEFHAQVGQLFNALLTLIVRVVPFLFLGMIAAAIYAPGTVAEPGEIWARMVRTYAPAGLLGLLVAGVFAAYMSTVSTLMNWGASYIVNDLYKPFIRQNESERHYVWIGRIGSIVIFALSLIVAYYFVEGLRAWFLFINSVVFAFILPLSWLRFFWWRLNIYGEAAALIIGLPLSYIVWFPLGFSNEQAHPFWQGFLLLFGLGFATILVVTYLTPPERIETLREFYRRCRPPGLWGPVVKDFSPAIRQEIRRETLTDLLDCALGIVFCTAAILAVISPLGRHWGIFIATLAVCVISGGLFIGRWARRGVFRSLGAKSTAEENTASHAADVTEVTVKEGAAT